jgi:opacity protein-like surface antigen
VHETKEIKDAKNADNTDNTDYKPKYELNKLGGGAAIGYSFAGMRVELEGLMSTEIKTETDSQIFKLSNDKQYKNEGFKHMTGMINAYYDLALSDDVTPYVGVGAGMSRVTNTTQDLKAWHIALQGKAGVMLNMGKSFVPYVGYRALWLMEKEYPDQKEWLSSGTPANPAQFKINHIIHNVEAGFLLPINV